VRLPALLWVSMLALMLNGSCAFAQSTNSVKTEPKPASAATVRANQAVAKSMAFNDVQDFADATRGLVATLPDALVRTAEGKVVWDTTRFDFVKGDAPASVNPSLWRQEKLNNARGLFKVTDGIYQVRGYDIANMRLSKPQPAGSSLTRCSHPKSPKSILLQGKKLPDLVQAGAVKLDGDSNALAAVFANVETFDPFFNIVTP
jgi:alkyl sulfatase BDS1-like metallo-beta-lactamase superfamily hydrolase